MSKLLVGLNVCGPMWSTKHHGPTVRRPLVGSARRTLNSPTFVARASVTTSSPSSLRRSSAMVLVFQDHSPLTSPRRARQPILEERARLREFEPVPDAGLGD